MPFFGVYWGERRSPNHLTKFCVTHQRMWPLALKHMITTNLVLGNFISHPNNIFNTNFNLAIWATMSLHNSSLLLSQHPIYKDSFFCSSESFSLLGFSYLVVIKFVLIYYKVGAFNIFKSKYNEKNIAR